MDYKITIVLDKRNKTATGYPAKLRVYDRNRKKAKLYTLNKYYSEADFTKITSPKPPKKNEYEAFLLNSIKSNAENVASKISVFNFNDFEKQFFNNNLDNNNIIDYYTQKIEALYKNNQVKSALNYQSSLKSLKLFVSQEKTESVKKIHVLDITVDWLNEYERFMLKNGKKISTIGFYLRPLKAIYNMVIEKNATYKTYYPFGRNKYIIPSTSKTKRALKIDTLKVLYNAHPKTKEQEVAKDFWFLSYFCCGLNINDIAYLKFENIQWEDDKIIFYRRKSIRTSKANLKEISCVLIDKAKDIIKKYQNKKISNNDYVFPIIKHNSAVEQKKDIENFIRFINQHIKKLAKDNGITTDLSTYWARHTFSTLALNNGASIELISESLGHSDIKTTKHYLNGFDDESKIQIISKITDFT
ncbi:tyrosine-type recombinase/integrase [Riemerella anatipestifer]|uniref:tyrosine-type recombinase/integrase n=1 Tax=Riemerella anatipestifer TaxID=34085 RepID=UPI0030C245AA